MTSHSEQGKVIATTWAMGALPRLNRRLDPATRRGSPKAWNRLSDEWKARYKALFHQFKMNVEMDIDTICEPVDMRLISTLHPLADSDAILKGIFDALEEAEIVDDDNRIEHYFVQNYSKAQGEEDVAVVQLCWHGDLIFLLMNEMLEETHDELSKAQYSAHLEDQWGKSE